MRFAVIIACMVLLIPLAAVAQLPTGTPLRVVFVTSTTSDGNIGGLAGADTFVQAAADSPSSAIPGRTVTAILSVTGTTAPSRFTDGGEPIYNTQGELVANDLTSMFAGGATALTNIILYDQAGNSNAGIAWTGTDADGSLAPTHCTSFSTNSSLQGGRIGRSDEVDGQWTEWGGLNCVNPARVYGLTDVFVVGAAPAVGPAALGLLVLVLVVITTIALRRRLT